MRCQSVLCAFPVCVRAPVPEHACLPRKAADCLQLLRLVALERAVRSLLRPRSEGCAQSGPCAPPVSDIGMNELSKATDQALRLGKCAC